MSAQGGLLEYHAESRTVSGIGKNQRRLRRNGVVCELTSQMTFSEGSQRRFSFMQTGMVQLKRKVGKYVYTTTNQPALNLILTLALTLTIAHYSTACSSKHLTKHCHTYYESYETMSLHRFYSFRCHCTSAYANSNNEKMTYYCIWVPRGVEPCSLNHFTR